MGAFMELCFLFSSCDTHGQTQCLFPFFHQTTFSPALSSLLSSLCPCDYILSNCFRAKTFTVIHIANLVVLRLFHWIWPDGGQITLLCHQEMCAWDTFVNVMYSLQQQSAHVWPQTLMMTWCHFGIKQTHTALS